MKKPIFWLIYVLLVIAQMLLTHFLRVSPYLTLCILPVMVLCISTRVPTWVTMVIAFLTGLAVDLLSEGIVGLNVLALVPVAFVRKEVIRLIFGDELFARKEDFSMRKNGFGKVALAIFLVQALFLGIYIWADGAGTRPLAFNAIRFGVSLGAGWIVSLLIVDILAPDTRK